MEKILPGQDERSIAVEQSILSSLLIHTEDMPLIADSLQSSHFYRNAHKVIYQAMHDLYEQNRDMDISTLCDALERRGLLEDAGGANYLYSLVSVTGDILWSVNPQADAESIATKACQRSIIHSAGNIAAIGQEGGDVATMLQKAAQVIANLDSRPASGLKPISEIMTACLNEIDRAYELRHSVIGVPTGFRELDKLSGGLQPTDLILLAARPAMGKTALGMNIGYNAAVSGKRVAVFSLEMGERQLGHRLISLVSGVPAERIRKGWIKEDEWKLIVDAQDHISDLPISINDTSGSPVVAIKSSILRRQAELKAPIDLVIIDYLQLMKQPEESEKHYQNRVQEIGKISRGLKGLAKELNVPILALTQLSRAVEGRVSKIPQLSDLRDSGELEQDADIVMFVYRDDYYNRGIDEKTGQPKSDRPGTADIIIAKNRNGQVGEVSLKFEAQLTRFKDVEAPR